MILLHLPVLVLFFAAATPAAPQADSVRQEKLVDDIWTVILMNGEETGWTHTRVVEIGEGEELRYRSDYEVFDRTLNMGDVTVNREAGWSLEDHRGRLLEVHDRMDNDGEVTRFDLVVSGQEAEIVTTTLDVPRRRTMKWERDVLGDMGVWLLTVEHGAEPGTEFSFKAFDGDTESITTNTCRVLEVEDVDLLDGEVRRLRRCEETCSALPNISIVSWCDEELDLVKYEVDMAGLVIGEVRTTQERAKRNESTALRLDVSDLICSRCDVDIPSLTPVDSITYRLRGRDEALGMPRGMGGDLRQTIVTEENGSVLLRVEVVTPPAGAPLPREPHAAELAEYLEPNSVIQSDHPELRARALEIADERTDAWEVACRLERFVYDHIVDCDVAMGYASAGRVFESQAGDCTEHAVLLAAMARAVGLPSRIASGFTYMESAFWAHAWTEVWIDGEWYALDATLGEGRVDPGHIRFSTESHRTSSSVESWLADLQGFNLDVEVVEFTCAGRRHDRENGFRTDHVEGDVYRNSLYGLRLVKAPEQVFDEYDEELEEGDPTLVLLLGQCTICLMAEPLQTDEEYEEALKAGGLKVLSRASRKVGGVSGVEYALEDEDGLYRVVSFSNEHATFTLFAILQDEDEDRAVFESVLRSVEFE